MISTDVHFRKGGTHNICEDYGISNNKMIIIADGCSTSQHSDVAARVIAHSCQNHLRDFEIFNVKPSYDLLQAHILKSLLMASQLMCIEQLLSTLLVSFIYKNSVITHVYGDGFIVYKLKGIQPQIIQIDFFNNTPNYIWYLTNPEHYKAEGCDIMINGDVHPRNYQNTFEMSLNTLEYIAIFTDGISSFIPTKPKEGNIFGNKITPEIAIENLTHFKSTKGKFVVRRLNRFLQQTKESGFIHDDDITCAVMYFGDKNDQSI